MRSILGVSAGPSQGSEGVSFSSCNDVFALDPDLPLSSEGNKNEYLRSVIRLVHSLCPEAVHDVPVDPPRSCSFEGHFAQVSRTSSYESAPILFGRFEEIIEATHKRFANLAREGKAPSGGLLQRKKLFEVPDASFLHKQIPLNKDIGRIMNNVSARRSTDLSFEELGRLEEVAKNALEAQSLSYWLFNTVINWLRELHFDPAEPNLFEELIRSFANSMVSSSSLTASLATYFQAKRREACLSHFQASVEPHFKRELAASSFVAPDLFEDTVLEATRKGSREDTAHKVQLNLSKLSSKFLFSFVCQEKGI